MNIEKLSFNEACEKTGRNPEQALRYAKPANSEEEAANALDRLKIFTEAYNMVDGKKWEPDYSNSNQAKWWAWFRYDGSLRAFVFYVTFNDCTHAAAGAGSRLVSRTSEIARFIGVEHIDDWNKWLS